ncbi:hypothetical protein CABS01_15669 [Colletotrichum abscissum]|uniref:Uncharacterized protein n=4 Tax=Colletotrichum acutatum species complex TaxID=2707335 RepID=A0A9Q8WBW4_9PEZI|nr:uncharacterized protein CLUP02_02406 [Colletotrichum lupini]XP_060305079.1 uncharacterized protein CCOS01_16178 [Colletotrichum costaricense]XP_060389327.1 uncharacterized protein CTAM01_12771 [Colletotrichum tamarilloi]XP_060391086.1 uncharacterized protein CABS01_15669 [Colletotrichum abscissum]KAI3549959.1 hypothetical protein CSPX01_02134 [Colletotrichum filicis]KAK1467499.1 hypothetical protein CMEL01_11492 [Colletotrichum melonis]KAK1474903.1 hypothetical protein CABS01_15669 [Collet
MVRGRGENKGDKDTRRARPRTCLLQVLFFLGVVTAGLCGAAVRRACLVVPIDLAGLVGWLVGVGWQVRCVR